eukprot:m.115974 g.115974  ORF g.115974 m.115974 type:complete len:60 (-) comp13585_c0_seq15:250-429(-)
MERPAEEMEVRRTHHLSVTWSSTCSTTLTLIDINLVGSWFQSTWYKHLNRRKSSSIGTG